MFEGFSTFQNSAWFAYGLLPFLIFAARVCDVSLATIRVLFIARGQRFLAPAVGFFEVLIWLAAISQILQRLDNPFLYAAYAGGFAAGTFAGITFESKLALGVVLVRVITREDASALIERLKEEKFGLTYLDAKGASGTVQLIFTLVKRYDATRVVELIKAHNPRAFYSIEDVRFARDAVPPVFQELLSRKWLRASKRK